MYSFKLMVHQISFTDFVDTTGSDSLELLDNERISQLTSLEVDRIWKSTRMKSRYILRTGKTANDIAEEAVQRFFKKTGIDQKDIGGLALGHTHYEGDDSYEI